MRDNSLLTSAFGLAAAAFAAIILTRAAITILADLPWLVSQTPDDAYYYYQIARWMHWRVGSTFDGSSLTNGYHPLWMMLCITMTKVVAALGLANDVSVVPRAMQLLQLCFGVGAVAVYMRAVRRLVTGAAAAPIALACCAMPPVIYSMTDGLESGLVLLFVATLIFWITRSDFWQKPGWSEDLGFGCVLAIGFLARLDLALISLSIGIAWSIFQAANRPDSGRLRQWLRGVLWAIPVLITVAIYLAINKIHFGMMTPISGKLKSGFPIPSFSNHGMLMLIYGVGSVISTGIALAIIWRRRAEQEALVLILLIGFLFTLLHGFHSFFLMRWGVYTWHFSAYWFLAILGAVVIVREMTLRPVIITLATAAVVLVAVAGQWHFLHGRPLRAFQAQSLAAALDPRPALAYPLNVAMSDCGVFGYYRKAGGVVNLDGLVNDMEYQETLARQGLAHYLHEKRIHLVAYHAVPVARIAEGAPLYRFAVRPRLVEGPGERAILLPQSSIVYQGPIYDDGTGPVRFVIWRVGPGLKALERN